MKHCDIVVPIVLKHTNEGVCTAPWFVQNAEYSAVQANYEPLINGEAAFGSVYKAIDGAEKSIDIICWGFQPSMYFVRDGAHPSIGELLRHKASLGVQVRVLAWEMPGNTAGMEGEANLPGKAPNVRHRAGQTATDAQHDYDEWWFKAFGVDDDKAAQRVLEKVPVLVTRGFSLDERSKIRDDVVHNGLDRELSTGAIAAMMGAPSHHQKSVLVDYELPEKTIGFVMGHNMLDEYWDTDAHSALRRPERKNTNPSPATHDPDRGPRGFLPRQDISCRLSGPFLEYLHHNFANAWQQETGEDLLTLRQAKQVAPLALKPVAGRLRHRHSLTSAEGSPCESAYRDQGQAGLYLRARENPSLASLASRGRRAVQIRPLVTEKQPTQARQNSRSGDRAAVSHRRRKRPLQGQYQPAEQGDAPAHSAPGISVSPLTEIKAKLAFTCVHETIPAAPAEADVLFQYASCKLQAASCKLQAASCKLQAASCKLQAASCKLQGIRMGGTRPNRQALAYSLWLEACGL